ncbi:MAG: PAS domain S-box protein [Chloroherpetonaceae bacterium]
MARKHPKHIPHSAAAREHSPVTHTDLHHGLSLSILNQIYQKAGDAIIIFEPHSEQVLEVNNTACAIYGYAPAEFRSLSMKQLTKDVERGVHALERVLNGEDIGNFETIQYKKNGEEIVMLCRASLIEYEGKTAILSINRDITAERKRQAEILEKSLMLDLIVKTSQVGFYILDLETQNLYFSPSYKAQLGYSDEAFSNHYDEWKSRLHPDDAAHAVATVNDLIKGKTTHFELLHRLRHKNGDYRWIVCNSIAIQNGEGKPTKIIGVHIDITSLRHKDLALRDSEEKFSRVFHRVPVAISIVELETKKFLDVNEHFEHIFELKRDEVIGKTLTELHFSVPSEHTRIITDCLSRGVPAENLEYEFTCPSGKTRFLTYSVETVVFMGKPYVVTVTSDVTEQRLAQAEQQRLTEQLFQSQKLEAIGRLASGIAHDFNNVLGIIKMSSGILRHKLSNPDFLRYLTSIEDAAQRGANISRQLLTFARREEPKMEPVSVQKVIEQVITMLRHSLPKTIDLKLQVLTTDDVIKGDSTQIYQAMLNLGINARDAMPNGGEICFELSQVSSKFLEAKFGKQFETPFLLVKVKDSGIGMSPEVKRRIFEPFFTTKPGGKGTGLGLSIIHGVVKSHHGYIEVESEEGKGTTFLLYFPLLYATEHPEPNPRLEKTILLVEDEPDMRNLLSDILTEKKFRVLCAQHGSEGLSLFLQSPSNIDLVLTDLNMPNLSGMDMLMEMKRATPNLKFAVLTGFLTEETRAELTKLGAIRILQKPIQIDDLFSLLDEVF